MAIYHFSARVVKRSAGRSAVAASAYRSANDLEDERQGVRHNYDRKTGVVHSEIMAPADAPEWMRDRSRLWNAVEAVERRKDAQLARDLTLALPDELDAAQRRDLVRQFVAEQFVAQGMIADVNIHDPHHAGDQRNHHAHIMLTTRDLLGEGFGKKNRDWNQTAQLERWREAWATMQNQHLESLGIDSRVDHRSLSAQGIDREAEQHQGPVVTSMKRRGDRRDVAEENTRRKAANDNRADLHEQLLAVKIELAAIRAAQAEIVAERQADIAAETAGLSLELELTQAQEVADLDHMQAQTYQPHLATIAAQAETLERRHAEAGTVRRVLRTVTGRSRADRDRLDRIKATIAATHERMKAERDALAQRHRHQLAQAATHARERKQEATQSVYDANRLAAEQAADQARTQGEGLSLAERLTRRAELLQEQRDTLEQHTEHTRDNDNNDGLGFEIER